MSRADNIIRRQGKAAWRGVSGFLRHDGGTTAIEYSMIAAGIGLLIITIVFVLGGTLSSSFYGNLLSQFQDNQGG